MMLAILVAVASLATSITIYMRVRRERGLVTSALAPSEEGFRMLSQARDLERAVTELNESLSILTSRPGPGDLEDEDDDASSSTGLLDEATEVENWPVETYSTSYATPYSLLFAGHGLEPIAIASEYKFLASIAASPIWNCQFDALSRVNMYRLSGHALPHVSGSPIPPDFDSLAPEMRRQLGAVLWIRAHSAPEPRHPRGYRERSEGAATISNWCEEERRWLSSSGHGGRRDIAEQSHSDELFWELADTFGSA
jgi:hypothetical protein